MTTSIVFSVNMMAVARLGRSAAAFMNTHSSLPVRDFFNLPPQRRCRQYDQFVLQPSSVSYHSSLKVM